MRYRQIAVQTFVVAELAEHRPRTWEHLIWTLLEPEGNAEAGMVCGVDVGLL